MIGEAPHSAQGTPRHAPTMFVLAGGELIVGGLALSRLAEQVGRTPFYAYDRKLIAARVAELRAALPPEGVELHYAMKANPFVPLVCLLARHVDGIDVASGGELKVALDAGADPQHISFAGPGKREPELRQAIAAGVLINVESVREIQTVARVARELRLDARVAVRINPDFELKGSGMKMGGGPKPFGIDVEQVPDAIEAVVGAQLAFEGFHLFAGSQNLRADSICEAQCRSYELALRLSRRVDREPRFLNLGGGFGIPYFPGEERLDLARVADNVRQLRERARLELPGTVLVLELGRYLVGEAGIYVARVIDRKVSRGQVFLVIDGGLHHHLAASGNFGQVLRKNYPVAIGNRMTDGSRERVTVVGPLCTPLDVLADKAELARAEPGDLVVVFQSGAYGASASPQAFLGHPPCLEVLV